jgi:alkyl sulfatase BDS1-like metallo-beta-lactamase superfamily hydrolase
VRLNGPDAAGRELTINFVFPDTNQTAWLRLENGALSHSVERTARDPDATVTLDRETLNRIVSGQLDPEAAIASGEVDAKPDASPLIEIISLLDTFSPWFAVIEP